MVGAGDFVPVSLQTVLFTPDEGLAVPRLIRDIAPKWARFDAPPTLLPELPPGGFTEVPRAILRSSDQFWHFEAGQARASVVCRETEETAFPTGLDGVLAESAAMLGDYRDAFNMRVGRLAAVLVRAALVDDPGPKLAQHFCAERWWKGQPLNRPAAFELHAHKRYEIRNWGPVNSWMRIKTGTKKVGEAQRSVIVTEQDINTFPEDAASKAYSNDEVQKFFACLVSEFDEILGLYFPGGPR